ncbi:MAG: pilus assembly protein TadG-related protein [Actinomycetota bacterium]
MNDVRERLGDERGLILKTLIILLVVLVLGGVALADTGSILLAKFRVADAAQEASTEAAFVYKNTRDRDQALQVAIATVHDIDPGARVKDFAVDTATGTVTVTVRKKVSTIAVKFFGFLEGFEKAESTNTAPSPQ